VTAPTGRREAHKQATRAALRAAAMRLFAEQGYDATTVADIARAANVTQRTFYRYFDGKEDLIAGEYGSWLTLVAGAIRARPSDEPPLAAVWQAMNSVAQQADADGAPAPLWLFAGRPLAGMRQSGSRPLLRLEATIAGALLDRRASGEDSAAGVPPEFEAHVAARVIVAVFRSALIRHRELQASGADSPGPRVLLGQAFTVITGQGPVTTAPPAEICS
jgi:AcrR family transcriptional regulator